MHLKLRLLFVQVHGRVFRCRGHPRLDLDLWLGVRRRWLQAAFLVVQVAGSLWSRAFGHRRLVYMKEDSFRFGDGRADTTADVF